MILSDKGNASKEPSAENLQTVTVWLAGQFVAGWFRRAASGGGRCAILRRPSGRRPRRIPEIPPWRSMLQALPGAADNPRCADPLASQPVAAYAGRPRQQQRDLRRKLRLFPSGRPIACPHIRCKCPWWHLETPALAQGGSRFHLHGFPLPVRLAVLAAGAVVAP